MNRLVVLVNSVIIQEVIIITWQCEIIKIIIVSITVRFVADIAIVVGRIALFLVAVRQGGAL